MRRFAMLGMIVATLVTASVPAAAQSFSDGFEFLKAVKDRDGDKVSAALDRPGSTIVNARDLSNGQGALHVVAQRRDAVWLRFLLGRGANPNLADRNGATALQLAANLGWTDGVDILIARGASVDLSNSAGETPLITAVHRRDAGLVRSLLKAGADPDRNDNSGRSARDYATQQGSQAAVIAALDEAREQRKARAATAYGPGN